SGPMLASADANGQREALFEATALKAARGEQQDERFRLLYVALTRAQQACHVFTLPPNRPSTADGKAPKLDPERSALDALLARWPDDERGNAHPHVEWRRGWPTPSALRAPRFDDGVALDAVEAPAPGPFALPGRYSFSWLTSGEPQAALEPRAADDEATANVEAPNDVDEALDAAVAGDALDAALDAALAALSMVRGPGFGNAWHALLETPTPGRRYADEPARVLDALRAQAVRRDDGGELDALVMPVAAMLDRAWTTPLPLPGAPVLGALPPQTRTAERGFHFRLDGVDWAALRSIAARHGEPALIPSARDARLRGSMEGFVDLVFDFNGRAHVLDWKGNALPTLAAARPDGLRALMDAHHYRFQALLYTVALHRLLRQRHGARYAIARHLGPPVYVFLRAFGLAPAHAPTLGAWTQDFAPALV
ncbi:MAG: PD-(D/E)XK nuclease family protein, partial [Silanimonas sp.]